MNLNEKYLEIVFKDFLDFLDKQNFLDPQWRIADRDRLIQEFFVYQKFPNFEAWDEAKE